MQPILNSPLHPSPHRLRKFVRPLFALFVGVIVHPALTSPAIAQTATNMSIKLARTREIYQADKKAAKIPSQRAALVAQLALSLPNVFPKEWETDDIVQTCWRLSTLKAVEAAPELARYTSFSVQTTVRSQDPAIGSLSDIGQDVVPAIINVLAGGSLVRNSTNYLPPWYARLTPDERALVPYKPEYEVFVWVANFASRQGDTNWQTLVINEYGQKAVRLRSLKEYLVEPKEDETPDETKVVVEVPTLFASANEARVAEVLELHYTLTDQLAPSTEAKVLAAIADAQKLKAFELAPDLCDKLDPASAPKTDADKVADNHVLAANPKGRLSPAIAEASEAALRSMGREALPALLDAVSTYGRGPAYREKAMRLIFAAAGGNSQARSALEQAAKVNDERAARLRAIIEDYKKPVD